MWANAQRDGRSAKHRWRPLFNAAVWLTPTTRVPCSNAARTGKFTILWGHVEELLLLNKFYSNCRYVP